MITTSFSYLKKLYLSIIKYKIYQKFNFLWSTPSFLTTDQHLLPDCYSSSSYVSILYAYLYNISNREKAHEYKQKYLNLY